jgi:phosphate transport system protein
VSEVMAVHPLELRENPTGAFDLASLGAEGIAAQLECLWSLVGEMGALVHRQLDGTLRAFADHEDRAALRVIANRGDVAGFDHRVTRSVLAILRRPGLEDDQVRDLIAAAKVSAELLRLADLAAGVAQRAAALNCVPETPGHAAVNRMGWMLLERFERVFAAHRTDNAEFAAEECIDREDVLYPAVVSGLFAALFDDPREITPCMELMAVVESLACCAEHVTRIAELACRRTGVGRPAQ